MRNIENETVEAAVYPSTYSEAKGTGVASTLIFAVMVFVIMFLLAYFRGY